MSSDWGLDASSWINVSVSYRKHLAGALGASSNIKVDLKLHEMGLSCGSIQSESIIMFMDAEMTSGLMEAL